METMTPTAQLMIDNHFARLLADLGSAQTARTLRVRRHFIDFVEREGSRVMVASQLTALALELEFDPVGAVGRVLVPIDVLWLLELYLRPHNLLRTRADAQRQVRVMAGLAERVIAVYGWDDVACCALEVRAALQRLRAITG
ncbi:hypothetical protein HQQ81_07490 [Microbacteriaceae bacterium VKM Ac-2854]|nr:hypothetical protein [Microbacteriaceae bacterium VKM Ac-2854]